MMTPAVKTICVLGGGSAGYLAALTMRRLLPGRNVIAVHSPDRPVIGVGESTTAYFPYFLHRQLGLDQKQFYAEVQPSWKLGIRFVWGPSEIGHFNYPFGFEFSERSGPLRKRAAFYYQQQFGHVGPVSALMDQNLSPCVADENGEYQLLNQRFGYHIHNQRFLAYLDRVCRGYGVEFIADNIIGVTRGESGDVESLILEDGNRLKADLFVDCSGFESQLLGKALGERFVDYGNTLFCDTAIVGGYERSGPILPYTTAETMDHGWCWQIDLPSHVTLGYVHSSQFCTPEEARDELCRRKPDIGDNLRVIHFPSGRYENYWVRNVVAIGNASGFVEPLESTALHVIAEQLINTCAALLDSDYRIEPAAREIENLRFRRNWDSIRDFLALHYKFNRRLETPFWRHCREHTDIGTANAIVDIYRHLGPHAAMKTHIPGDTLVQFEGYLALLLGQQVETQHTTEFDAQDLLDWSEFQRAINNHVARAIPVRDALKVVGSPDWKWR